MKEVNLRHSVFLQNVFEPKKIKVLNKYISFFNLLCAAVIGIGGTIFFYDATDELGNITSTSGYTLMLFNFTPGLLALLSPYLFLLLLNSLAQSRTILLLITVLNIVFAWFISIGLAINEIIINSFLGLPVVLNFEWGYGFLIMLQFGFIFALLFIPTLVLLLKSVKTKELHF